jgi:hypothetical protein
MLTEMLGKGGTLCSQARAGQIRCPLIIRPTSEDVITGHLFQSLRCINPRWWLPDLVNQALGTNRFRRQVYRRLEIDLWQNQPCYPRELLPWDEGSTQVDAVITWENPPTTVLIEMKFLSELSDHVSNDDGESGFPSDQLIRNIRVGLYRCGYFQSPGQLFPQSPRNLVVLVVAPRTGHPLVARYRDSDRTWAAIPNADRLMALPRAPFVGELSYADIVAILGKQARWFSRPERLVIGDITAYLEYKLMSRTPKPSTRINPAADRETGAWSHPHPPSRILNHPPSA